MDIVNEFDVSVPIDEAWKVLTDLERIAPCMPGATLEGVVGDDFLGTVKIKVGPITSLYKGKIHFTERDDENHRATLRAEGRDTKGQGNANATIVATLTGQGSATHCKVEMNLTISGRVAQFGRGVLADVSQKLVEQFVSALETEVLGEAKGSTAVDATEGVSSGETQEKTSASDDMGTPGSTEKKGASNDSVNALGLIAKPVAKRALPVFAILVVLGILIRRTKRASGH
ncbi:MAG: SRPBCC family protein [Acidimicrobiales bacterium]